MGLEVLVHPECEIRVLEEKNWPHVRCEIQRIINAEIQHSPCIYRDAWLVQRILS
ncbi:hypothetical protein [Acidithiobacillus sp.]|uniref:hypothetical protein n=1 Tax=Acidithiobacillus sp. TaxID=1872118 RepID=UPI0025B8FEAF|nr:hypothetical protein [Acidithiobacillus sp.]